MKFAIIGCGRIGARHALHIAEVGSLVAVCDVVKEKATELAEMHDALAFTSVEELILAQLDVDVVAVCTPNGLHAEHSIACLSAGFHVLCEKPMALSIDACNAMIEAAEENSRHLFIVKQNRYNPPVEALKKLVDSGKLGRLYGFQLNCFWNRNKDYYKSDWKGTKGLDGGVLFTQFSHFIDLVYWLLGDLDQCFTLKKKLSNRADIEFEDTVVVAAEMKSGIVGSMYFTINAYQSNMEGSLTLFAEKGTLKIGGQYLNELEYQNVADGLKIENLPKGNPANNYGEYTGSMSNHDKVYQNVVEVLQGKGVIATSGFEGKKTVEFIHKILKES